MSISINYTDNIFIVSRNREEISSQIFNTYISFSKDYDFQYEENDIRYDFLIIHTITVIFYSGLFLLLFLIIYDTEKILFNILWI